MTGIVQDIAYNEIVPEDLNITANADGNYVSSSSLSSFAVPTATVDHYPPRAVSVDVRIPSSDSIGTIPETDEIYKFGDTFVFTVNFHENVNITGHEDNLANLELNLDFDDNSTDRGIALSAIPTSSRDQLQFTYVVATGDQAVLTATDVDGSVTGTIDQEYNQSLGINGFEQLLQSLVLEDDYGNSIIPEDIDFRSYDADGNGTEETTETEQFLQPDYPVLVDGISPYWVSISTSRDDADVEAFGLNENITFTLTASEDLAEQSGMQLKLLLRDEDGNEQNRSINGEFCRYDPDSYDHSTNEGCFTAADASANATETNQSVIIFPYIVGSDSQDRENNGIDHSLILSQSAYDSGSSFASRDIAGNEFASHSFADIPQFIVPDDNALVFDTTPPIVKEVLIEIPGGTNLATIGRDIEITLSFTDGDLNLSVDSIASGELNITAVGLSTGDSNGSVVDVNFSLDGSSRSSLAFSGSFTDNIDWSGLLTLHISDYNNSIIDESTPPNSMSSSLVVGSGSDSLIGTYIVDTTAPRVANKNEITTLVNSPITSPSEAYGPGRELTFQLTFNELLSSMTGGSSGLAYLDFYVYDTDTGALEQRRAFEATNGTDTRPRLSTTPSGDKSVAYFYYTVVSEDDGVTDDDGDIIDDNGPVYLSSRDTAGSDNKYGEIAVNVADNFDYPLCNAGAQGSDGTTYAYGCYIGLNANLYDENNNPNFYGDSADEYLIYAFNRYDEDKLDPYTITNLVTDPLEIVSYSIRTTTKDEDQRAFGIDDGKDKTDNDANTTIDQTENEGFIGASETETIFFIVEPGFEGFELNDTAPVDINLTFSLLPPNAPDFPEDDDYDYYVATYFDSNTEEITLTFAMADFGDIDYESNIRLHKVSQAADIKYSGAGASIEAFTDIEFSANLDMWSSNSDGADPAKFDNGLDGRLDTGLYLDLKKPALIGVSSYALAEDGTASELSSSNAENLYFGRGDRVVFQFMFDEPIGKVVGDGSGTIQLPLELSTGQTIIAAQAPPTIDDPANSTTSDLNITYTILDNDAGEVVNNEFNLTAIVTDTHENSVATGELDFSLIGSNIELPLFNGEFPSLEMVNIYRSFTPNVADAEVSNPVPDLSVAPQVDSYTFTGDGDFIDKTFFIAATFTYSSSLGATELPHFGNSSNTLPDTNYSFDLGINNSPEYNATLAGFFSESNNSSSYYANRATGENVMVFSFDVENAGIDNLDSEGNFINLLELFGANDLSSDLRDAYGNPIAQMPDSLPTVVAIDNVPPELIGLQIEPPGTTSYGPLDTNITFALTFSEPLNEEKATSDDNLRLQFTVTDDNNDAVADLTIFSNRNDTGIYLPDLDDSSNAQSLVTGQVVYMMYTLLGSTIEEGYINASVASIEVPDTSTIYDTHKINVDTYADGNNQRISKAVTGTSTADDVDFFVPVITINRSEIEPNYWSIEYTEGNSIIDDGNQGLAYENNNTNSLYDSDARVGIDKTVSFIIGYEAVIEDNSVYNADDTISRLGETTLNISFESGDNNNPDGDFNATFSQVNTVDGQSKLTYTYDVVENGLIYEELTFVEILLPSPDSLIRSSEFNEIVISGSEDFEQETDTIIDGTYPELLDFAIYEDRNLHQENGIYYFGENAIITFELSFSEVLLDDDNSIIDNEPNIDLEWYIFDEITDSVRSIDTIISDDTSNKFQGVITNYEPDGSFYQLYFPINLIENSASLEGLQGRIFLSGSTDNRTTVYTDESGDLRDLARNERDRMEYVHTADENLTFAVDFIRPQLQYIVSEGSDPDLQYIQYASVAALEPTAIYYGRDHITFHVVHDSPLNRPGSSDANLTLFALDYLDGPKELQFSMENAIGDLPTAEDSTLTDNAPQFTWDLTDSAYDDINYSASQALTFSEIDVSVYGDRVGNKPYFDLTGTDRKDYNTANLLLSLDNYIPSAAAEADQQFPQPTIYVDTTPPIFEVTSTQDIEVTNLALVFAIELDAPLSDLEANASFNDPTSDPSLNSAPTYELSIASLAGSTVTGLLSPHAEQPLGNNGETLGTITTDDNQSFIFSFFFDPNSYGDYLDDLADNTDHAIELTLTDFIGNSFTHTFNVHKKTDKFLALISGWDSDNGVAYNTENQPLANDATEAIFLVSFVADINESTLSKEDFTLSYSGATTDDLQGLYISDTISENRSGLADYDYLVTVTGGNLPLAQGSLELAFSASQDIATASGYVLNLEDVDDTNESYTYSKDFEFFIDAIAQLNPGSASESPSVELNFTAPTTGVDQNITGYKLYYGLGNDTPNSVNSPYFSNSESSTRFASSGDIYTFTHKCLLIPDGSSETYNFRVVAQYTIAADAHSLTYETLLTANTEGSTDKTARVDLNTTIPELALAPTIGLHDGPDLPATCSSSSISGLDYGIASNLGRAVALSSNDVGIVDDLYLAGDTSTGGAIRHYVRSGSQFERNSDDTNLDLAAQQVHTLAAPAASVDTVDLFAAGNPVHSTSGVNTGLAYLFNKTSGATTWPDDGKLDITPATEAASGSALAIAVVDSSGTDAIFALIGEPLSGTGGAVRIYEFDQFATSDPWTALGTLTLADLDNTAPTGFTPSVDDELLGSAIALSADSETVAIASSRAVYIFSLNDAGNLTPLHAILASDYLGDGASFTTEVASQARALAIQETTIANDSRETYLLAIGLPHDSNSTRGITYVGDSGFIDEGSTSTNNYGAVLLLTTTSEQFNSGTNWRRLAYLRSNDSSVSQQSFYGSGVLFTNPSQPTLIVSQPGYAIATDGTDATASAGNGRLHIYYLNTSGVDAYDQKHLILKASNTISGTLGYGYSFDYRDHVLAIGQPTESEGGEVSLLNLFPHFDYPATGDNPEVIASSALSSSNTATLLTFGVRFPATVDPDTIDSQDDFAVSFTTPSTGTNFDTADFEIRENISNSSLDYWEIIVDIQSPDQVRADGKSGDVYLLFNSTAEINSTSGLPFKLSDFTRDAVADGAATPYVLDFSVPTLESITKVNPTENEINVDLVTFELSFSDDLNTSVNLTDINDFDQTLEGYFSLIATTDSANATFDVTSLSSFNDDDGVDVIADGSQAFQVIFSGIRDIIYADSRFTSADSFDITLEIDEDIDQILGNLSNNPMDVTSLDSPTGTGDVNQTTYLADFNPPQISNIQVSGINPGAIIAQDTNITYAITFTEILTDDLTGGDFHLPITLSADNNYADGDDLEAAKNLSGLFDGAVPGNTSYWSTNGGSGFAITTTDNITFTLTLGFAFADYKGLVTEATALVVRKGGFEDIAGNSFADDYTDSTNLSISYKEFVLDSRSLSIIPDSTSRQSSELNFFDILDTIHDNVVEDNVSPRPSLGFNYTFSTVIDTDTVDSDLSDFSITINGTTYAKGGTNEAIELTYHDYDPASKQIAEFTLTYNLFDNAAIGYNDNSSPTQLSLVFELDPQMLETGFDLPGDFVVAIDPNSNIAAQSGEGLKDLVGTLDTAMTYRVNSLMPVLTQFARVDSTDDSADPADGTTSDYHTFTYTDAESNDDKYYGFRLRYQFSEAIDSVSSLSVENYTTPDHTYYLSVAGNQSLLSYTFDNTLGGSLPYTASGDYYEDFAIDGSLVQSQQSSGSAAASTTWDHLAYLSSRTSDFGSGASAHTFQIMYDDDYLNDDIYDDYEDDYTFPALLGGYGTSAGNYEPDIKAVGTLFLDAHGNPARVASEWLNRGAAESNTSLNLTYSPPAQATGAEATDVVGDLYTGSFDGDPYGDSTTFAFQLGFDSEIASTEDLLAASSWTIASDNTLVTPFPTPAVDYDGSDGTSYFYTLSNAVSGLYATTGTYSLTFDTNAQVTDEFGSPVDLATANVALANVCDAGVCSFNNTAVVELDSVSVSPSTATVPSDGDSSALDSFDVQLTFNQPVTFTGSINSDSDIYAAFDISYIHASGDLDSTIESLRPISASEDGSSGYYTQYRLSIDDNSGYWAFADYGTAIGVDSVVSVFFQNLQELDTHSVYFTPGFATSTGSLAAIPTTIQDGSITSTITYTLDTVSVIDTSASDTLVDEAGTATLEASASDDDGIASYSWQQVNSDGSAFTGTALTITNADTALATVTAPGIADDSINDQSFYFALTITDGLSDSTTSPALTLTVSNTYKTPAITYGANSNLDAINLSWTADSGHSYSLYRSSDSTCDISSYSSCADSALYTDSSGGITISGTSASVTDTGLTPDTYYYYWLEAQLNSEVVSLNTDPIQAATTPAPEVYAGIPNSQAVGTLASLRGSATADTGRTIASYLWQETTDFDITIDRADTANASFTVPSNLTTDTILSFQLTATDSEGGSASATTSITIADPGTEKWYFDNASGGVRSSPAIGADGTVYFGANDGNLYALNPQDGSIQWTFATGDEIQTPPAIGADGTVYFGSEDGNLYAVSPPTDDSQSGDQKWSYQDNNGEFGEHTSVSIAADGTLYFGSRDFSLHALDPANGSILWSYLTGDILISKAAISSTGTIYFGSGDRLVYAINPPSGSANDPSLRWSEATGSYLTWSSPAIGANDTVYNGSWSGDLHAFNSDTGAPQWSYAAADDIRTSPAIAADGTIYFGSRDYSLYALDSNGDYKWNYPTGFWVQSSPVIGADGTVYFGSDDDDVSALNPNGDLQWEFPTNGNVDYSSGALAPDGTLFIGSITGLYAIHTASAGLQANSPWPKFGQNNRHSGRVNLEPTANAGADQSVIAGDTVNLDATASTDSDGIIIDYYWRETSSYGISIANNNSAQASFTAPAPISDDDNTITIELTVTDDHSATATTTHTITLN